jgi:hypothetical protein
MLYCKYATGANSFGGGGRGRQRDDTSSISGRPVGSNNGAFTLKQVLVASAVQEPPFTHQVCPTCPEHERVQPWDSYLWDLKRNVWVPVLSVCQKNGHAAQCTPHNPVNVTGRYIGKKQAGRLFNEQKEDYRQWLSTSRHSTSPA